MNCNFDLTKNTTQVRNVMVTAIALLAVFVLVNQAMAQTIPSPVTPTQITPQAGNAAFLVGHAKGTQGYVCLPTKADPAIASWTVNGARPEATLFADFFGHDFQIITHFLSPDEKPIPGVAPNPLPFGNATWQSSFDSSRVWAQATGTLPAGTDPSCPNANSIACLLLQSIGNDVGPTGGKLLADTTFIQRLNTKGGLAPATGCATATDVGKQFLSPYTADYYFFHGVE